MFTGLVECMGQISRIQPLMADTSALATGLRLEIYAPTLEIKQMKLGDSIAIQGACMTVVAFFQDGFTVDVSQESLSKTVGLNALGAVNLEQAMRLADRIGGHLVSGHVDGLGTVTHFMARGESWHLRIAAPKELAACLAYKGSVAVNGVSLTINQVDDHTDGGCSIHINLIAHTMNNTTLKNLTVGDAVNLEVDQLARYCQRIIDHQQHRA